MKHISAPLRNLSLLILLVTSFIACERDFATIDSDIIDENATHFDTRNNDYEVVAYTNFLDPVQGNNYPSNLLGYFNDEIYGETTANVLTQITPASFDPDFGVDVKMDSVVLNIPYFSTATGTEEEATTYELDSVFGNSPIDIEIFENRFFLRDLDPSGDNINEPQIYYTNGSLGETSIPQNLLEAVSINSIQEFVPSPEEIIVKDTADVINRFAPAFRVKLDTLYWRNKIIERENDPVLSTANNFRNYLRGLYFKVESIEDKGNLSILNFNGGSITIYYSSKDSQEADDRNQGTYALNFSGNRVNLISQLEFDTPEVDEENGDEKLYLKGTQGSYAIIKLFGGEDIDDDPSINQFEAFKNEFAETDEDGNFVRSKRLINEANLVVFVDQESIEDPDNQPERLYLFNTENNTPLVDYFGDLETADPLTSRIFHLGPLEREGDATEGVGVRYKFSVTEHIKSLIVSDSTNADLGLSVSANINFESQSAQFDVLSDNDNEKVPLSSLLTPRSTVLFGNNTDNESKKLYLEIFYTEPEINN